MLRFDTSFEQEVHLNVDCLHLIVSQVMSLKPIHEAAHKGDVEKLKQLLKEKPSDVDLAVEWSGWTSLMFAAMEGKLEAVKVLIEHKATIDKPNCDGLTALYLACSKGYAEIAAFLLDNQADVNQADNDGETALLRAVVMNQAKCVKLLLERKADTAMKATGGFYRDQSALDIAGEEEQDEIVSLLQFASTAAPPPAPPAPAPRVEEKTSSAVDSTEQQQVTFLLVVFVRLILLSRFDLVLRFREY